MGSTFRGSGFGSQVSGFGFRVPDFGSQVSGFGFQVSGLGWARNLLPKVPNECLPLQRLHPGSTFYRRRELNSNVSGTAGYYSACSLLVIFKNSFGKLHYYSFHMRFGISGLGV